MNHSLTAWTLAILFRILVLVFGLDIFIFFSFQCSIIHVWVISRWCHRQSHFERNVSEQFYFENNFFETIISKLFSTAQDQIKNWIRIREFTEDIGKIHERTWVFHSEEKTIIRQCSQKVIMMGWFLRNLCGVRI